MKKSIILLMFLPVLFGCSEMFEPALENHKDIEDLTNDSKYAQRILGHAYLGNPLRNWSFNDVATDDAVSNDPVSNYMRMAIGQWRADNSPMNNNWADRRGSIQYINIFLSILDSVKFDLDPRINNMLIDRMRGDACGMRALFMYHLLLEHAGWTDDGQLLGIPILTEPEDSYNSDFNLPRNTMAECIEQIEKDVMVARENLPRIYYTGSTLPATVVIPEKYDGVTGPEFMRVFSAANAGGRLNATIAEAILAQTYLLAASPAYSAGTGVTWEMAAKQMAKVLNAGKTNSPDVIANPLGEIEAAGIEWYTISVSGTTNPKEILWRGDPENNGSYGLEESYFPPTLFGNGRLNPTQNLVDAFPMANGYPITDVGSGYNANNPYAGRDSRLAKYIVLNGSTAGPSSTVINTTENGPDANALNRERGKSTRTGYYMRKHLIQAANPDPSSPNRVPHYKAYIRYTELFLGFAEAANEAWGSTDAKEGFSAYDVVKAIRKRAGVTGGDAYLESIKNDKNKMRELIRSERRLELCFEGHRFWDLRRWKAPITEPVRGMSIVRDAGTNTYTPITVEERVFADYMYYGPIPKSEVLKFNNLVQNKGW
ncbi:MAG: RagB/SusD family nutrient uptake outer membrane protein [Dysgonamonadaceae bacterium]|nr:RagB/SusD family nutrient uptake outer membrane protein [Dysgonamonadaceae bacterium]